LIGATVTLVERGALLGFAAHNDEQLVAASPSWKIGSPLARLRIAGRNFLRHEKTEVDLVG
jgi:hypothetical protein